MKKVGLTFGLVDNRTQNTRFINQKNTKMVLACFRKSTTLFAIISEEIIINFGGAAILFKIKKRKKSPNANQVTL